MKNDNYKKLANDYKNFTNKVFDFLAEKDEEIKKLNRELSIFKTELKRRAEYTKEFRESTISIYG